MRPASAALLALLAILPLAAVLLVAYAYRWLAVDSCLDRGGVYDYGLHACRLDVQSLVTGLLVSFNIVALCAAASVVSLATLLLWRRRTQVL